ncbi:MAG: hypothetical protein GY913_13315 [Proteobacteria bacterium]|nr:hypothetical protein [Pseudomonadota bacterium]MCP4917886.1 hypothetical protein [Pseudomonadota bacterium]
MKARALQLIREGGDVEAFALELFRYQRDRSPAYSRLVGDVEPGSLAEIPAIPVSLCKDAIFSTVEDGPVFRTSGTTSGRRGQHRMADTAAYDEAARRWFEACVANAPTRCVSLCPTNVDSSLGHMVRLLYPEAQTFFDESLDVDGAWDALAGGPVFLATTAFALAWLFESDRRVELAPGSVLMVTGGFKGRTRSLTEAELDVRARLGEVRRIDEYGMTELSSQLWGAPGQGFAPPPWLVPYTVDPLSGEPTDGIGLLRFVDCANWSSMVAIETEDLGEVRDGRVFLRGRLEASAARGCSLTAEEAHGA